MHNQGGLLNIATGANSNMIPEPSSNVRGGGLNSGIGTIGSSTIPIGDEEIYFQTEMYCEAIDGIYQERNKHTTASSCLSLNSTSSSKKTKEKLTAVDYFKNLTTQEICNLVYLIDLKCFSSLQSVYALFLSKSNSIGNLSGQLGRVTSSSSDSSNNHQLDRSNLSEFTSDVINNILAFNKNFVDSVRLLPDVSLVLKKHTLKESKHNSSG